MKNLAYLLLLTLVVVFAAAANAQNFKGNVEAELPKFIDFVATTTGKTILYNDTLKSRKIFLSNFQWQNKQDLYNSFLSVMEYNGFIVETLGSQNPLLKIRRNIQGPWTQTPVLFDPKELEQIKEQDQFVTMVIPLRYASAREIQTVMRALRIVNPQCGNLAGVSSSNMLMITDFAPNVKKFYQIVKFLDRSKLEKKPVIDENQAKFSLDKQKVALALPKDKDIFLEIKPNNTNVTVATGSNILAQADMPMRLWLNPYLNQPLNLDFTVSILRTGKTRCQLALMVECGKDKPKSVQLWVFSIERELPGGKEIKFSMALTR